MAGASAPTRWPGPDFWSKVTFTLTDWVIAETGNGLARTNARNRFSRAVELFRLSPRAEIISMTDRLLQESLQLYAGRSDKSWGLVDCASFVVMQENGIREAFTNDRHFKQAGLQCLLPDS